MATKGNPRIKLNLSGVRILLAKTWANWGSDEVPRLAAAFAFYAILSLAPMLVFAVIGAGYFYGHSVDAKEALLTQAQSAGGQQVAGLVKEMIEAASKGSSGVIATLISLAITFFSASNLFIQLNDTIYTIWGVKRGGSMFRSFIINRLAAFAGVLVFGALIVAWLGLDSWLGWLAKNYGGVYGWRALSFVASIVFLFAVCAISFRAIPRNRLKWVDVWPGAIFSSIGIGLTKLLLSQYFANFNVSAAYGSAGALVVILLWIYYTSQIYFFGAEITYTYSHEFGSRNQVEESGLTMS